MTQHDDIHDHRNQHADRAREDRIVEFLRSRGVFGGGASGQPAVASRDLGRLRTWRVPLIAAAAAVVIGTLSLVADRTLRPPAAAAQADPPSLLIWY